MAHFKLAFAALLLFWSSAAAQTSSNTYDWGPDYPVESRAVHGILCLQDHRNLSPHYQLTNILSRGTKKIPVVGNCAGGDFVFTVIAPVEILPNGSSDSMFIYFVNVLEVRRLDFRKRFPPSYIRPRIKFPFEAVFFPAEKVELLEGRH